MTDDRNVRRLIRPAAAAAGEANGDAPAAVDLIEQRPALVEQVVAQLRQRILEGEFSPDGELPPEGSLGEAMGVSRTVIREAMRILRAQGLVEVSQGKRPRVRPADPQFAIDGLSLILQRTEGSLLHLVEVRRPLEGEIAALAAERATPEQLQFMALSIEELRKADTLEQRVIADLQFHGLLADATGNPVFQMVLRTIWGLLRHSRMHTIPRSGVEVPVLWHTRILDAVAKKDALAARRIMEEHIDAARDDLKDPG